MEPTFSEPASRQAPNRADPGGPPGSSREDYIPPDQRNPQTPDADLRLTIDPATGTADIRARLSRLMPPENITMMAGSVGAVVAAIWVNWFAGVVIFAGTAGLMYLRNELVKSTWRHFAKLGMLLPLIQAASADQKRQQPTCCNHDHTDPAARPRDRTSTQPHNRQGRRDGEPKR